MSLIVRRQVVQGPPGKQGPVGPAGAAGIGSEAANVKTKGAKGNGTIDDTTAVQVAANEGNDEVYFPPGAYRVGSLTFSRANQKITFAPGAVLLPSATATITFSGAGQQISGLNVQVSTASSSTGNVVVFSGAGQLVNAPKVRVTAQVPNANLITVSGNRSTLRDVVLLADNVSFNYGVNVAPLSGDDQVRRPTIDGMAVDLLNGVSVTSRNYGALLRLRARNALVKNFVYEGTANEVFADAIISVPFSQRTVLINPVITQATGAKYAIHLEYACEFTTILSGQLTGRTNGTYLTDSEGIRCEHGAGHLKVKDTAINGWDIGISIRGTHDTPIIDGAVIAQNKTCAILIDSVVPPGPAYAGSWPVSGMSCRGMYFEYGAPGAGGRVIWCKTGSIEGLHVSGCLWGYQTHAVYVEDGFEELSGGWFDGNRLIGTLSGDAVIRPNATTDVQFGRNQLNVSNNISNGTYASNVSQVPRVYRAIATANFANTLTAGASSELAFSVADAAVGDAVTATLAANVATKEGFQCTAWVHQAGQIRIRGYNASATNHTSVSGTVTFEIIKH